MSRLRNYEMIAMLVAAMGAASCGDGGGASAVDAPDAVDEGLEEVALLAVVQLALVDRRRVEPVLEAHLGVAGP